MPAVSTGGPPDQAVGLEETHVSSCVLYEWGEETYISSDDSHIYSTEICVSPGESSIPPPEYVFLPENYVFSRPVYATPTLIHVGFRGDGTR